MNLIKTSLVKSIATKAKTSFIIPLLSFLIQGEITGQTFSVRGNVSTDSTEVRHASITFIDFSFENILTFP